MGRRRRRTSIWASSARRDALPWLLILPSLVLALGVICYPFFEILHLSVSRVSRFGQIRGFAGWDNFAGIVDDPIFIAALLRTLVWTGCVVGGTILVSMPVALVLREDFWGRGWRGPS